MATSPHPSLKMLPVFRLAMTLMVLIIGGVVWYLVSSGIFLPVFAANDPIFVTFFLVVLAGVSAVIVLIKRKRDRTSGPQSYLTYTLVCWSAAEGMAMLGAAFYLLTTNPTYYLGGVFLLLSVFLMVPVGKGGATDVLS